ncbi:protein methyltransferase [Bacterioplanes sanyensis]|uniref:Protein methyltransferase n=1 Tax=Bacterioplanes sanyensis TaxID=1249553 RepID=A0A222FJY4_9GAMM|nr:50S ribosomal protein L11 methyltransferase [Bacterioplanes sanyensis]ASP39318.1 protein methyltransferase [Bacterioplanes sanyensis]
MEIMSSAIAAELQASLCLPGASLAVSPIPDARLQLALLQLEDTQLLLDSRSIQQWWQNLPYWAFAWAGGQALARFISEHPQAVAGKNVLDFGCGSGIAGIAAAQAGANVVAVDLDPLALQAVSLNAELNRVSVTTVADLRTCPDDLDMVLAADVLYDISSNGDLSCWLSQVPAWLLAETSDIVKQRGHLPALQQIAHSVHATLPAIGDFDERVEVCIYQRQINDG